jgi:hypothetical protein
MLEPQRIATLQLNPALHPRGQTHVSAASALVRLGQRLYTVADDEQHLLVLSEQGEAKQWLRLLPGDLPHNPKARKAQKGDLEALLALPAMPGYPHGALLALGSGSKPTRERAALLALQGDAALDPTAQAKLLSLAALYAPLRGHIPDLNIEGALLLQGQLRLLHRGNQGDARNISIAWDWPAIARWLQQPHSVPPQPVAAHNLALGEIQGVALGLTDAASLPGQEAWVFSAVAEATKNSVNDGACVGSVIGLANAQGHVLHLQALHRAPKVEGICAQLQAQHMVLTMVTDADNPQEPSQLLRLNLTRWI